MTPTETTAILRQFNAWLRGDRYDIAAPTTREMGEAIDAAVEMIKRLEAAEKERDAAELMSLALQAKIAEMERQEPVAWRWELKAGQYTYIDKPEHAGKNARIVPLYALPGAQTQGEEE